MKLMAFESSTQLASVAYCVDGQLVQQEMSMRQKSHSEFINVALEKIIFDQKINLNQIDMFGTSLGPGSFTGIRVSANAAKALCYVHKKKLFSLDSLQLLAIPTAEAGTPILTLINAYKNLVYTALYEWRNGVLTTIIEPSVYAIAQLDSIIHHKTLVLGDGYKAYQPLFSDYLNKILYRDEKFSDHPEAKTLALNLSRSQTMEWNLFTPLYLRASEAEENLQKKLESLNGCD